MAFAGAVTNVPPGLHTLEEQRLCCCVCLHHMQTASTPAYCVCRVMLTAVLVCRCICSRSAAGRDQLQNAGGSRHPALQRHPAGSLLCHHRQQLGPGRAVPAVAHCTGPHCRADSRQSGHNRQHGPLVRPQQVRLCFNRLFINL